MSVKIANRMAQIRPSATIAVNQKARDLRAQGRDIISLAFGEPDFDTPEHIRAAAVRAIENGETRYPPIAGTPALNKAKRVIFMATGESKARIVAEAFGGLEHAEPYPCERVAPLHARREVLVDNEAASMMPRHAHPDAPIEARAKGEPKAEAEEDQP